VIVDGANAYYRDSMRRAQELAALGLHLVDAGVSAESGDSSTATA